MHRAPYTHMALLLGRFVNRDHQLSDQQILLANEWRSFSPSGIGIYCTAQYRNFRGVPCVFEVCPPSPKGPKPPDVARIREK